MIRWLALGGLLLVALSALALTTGSYPLTLSQLLQAMLGEGEATARTIVWELRLPRALQAALVGSCLAAAGAAFQSLLRSPLADPYLIGTSAGASLGTAVAVVLGLGAMWLPWVAFLGALASVALVMRMARQQGQLRLEDVLLVGVMTSTLLGSLVSLLLTLSGQEMGRLVFFLLGNLSHPSWPLLAACLPAVAIGLALLFYHAYSLNLLSLGEEMAAASGVAVESVKSRVLLGASLLTAVAVSLAGLVGFVGLVIPHLCRLWVGPDLRKVLPLTLLWGAAFLLLCDWLGRFAPHPLPVGVVTALTGAPWFLWQLRQLRQET